MRKIRGNKISVIFQEPMTSLNPSIYNWRSNNGSIILHQKLSKTEAKKKGNRNVKISWNTKSR